MRVFISSVQKEFARERKALGAYLSGDPLPHRFSESFPFERLGTGTRDMISKCRAAGLPEPEKRRRLVGVLDERSGATGARRVSARTARETDKALKEIQEKIEV